MTFSLEQQSAIDIARAKLTVTLDPRRQALLVTGLPFAGWMLFRQNPLVIEDMADNVRWDEVITGVPAATIWEITAAWDTAAQAVGDITRISHADHAPKSLITGLTAQYLAMHDRIRKWGGFSRERDDLKALALRLTPREQTLVVMRLAGTPLCPPPEI